ncbi:MAG TPA: protein translocase subunit SecD [Ignavibacteriaceae bacterium]
MKEFRFKIIVILAALALSVYLLWPTYKDYSNNKSITEIVSKKQEEIKRTYPEITKQDLQKKLVAIEDSIRVSDPSIADARQKRIKLGLDLQGGMRVVLEVNTAKLLEKLAKNPDDVFKKVLTEAEKEAALSNESVVDIVGRKFEQRQIRLSRYFGTIREDDDEILNRLIEDSEDAVARAIEIIRNRVDQYGVSEPSIQRQGSRRIIVELPGVAKEEEAKNLLQGTALLEFRILKDPEFAISLMQKIDNVLAGKNLEDTTKTDTTTTAKTETKDTSLITADTSEQKQLSEEEFKKEHPFFAIAMMDPQGQSADAYVREGQKSLLTQYLNRDDVQKVMPNNVEFIYSAKPVGVDKGENIYMMYLVNKNPELTGGVITDAQANIDPSTSSPIVSMEMNSEGATDWARITGANVGKRIAIMLDGVAFSAPVVRGKIPGGRSQIEGMANMEEAKLLEIVLKAGALPAPVDIIEERTVGPSLGQDSVNSGFTASIIGYIVVGFFMIFYYRKSGSIAAVGLVLSILFILAILAGFGATLTLPGIAGIILTMGMAVDANVLIFERIREEMETGKTIKASIDGGYSKSFSAIFDSNITTFFTGLILYQFGTGPVQGFALTLMIGIVTSLFSALFISRFIFNFLVSKGSKISIG